MLFKKIVFGGLSILLAVAVEGIAQKEVRQPLLLQEAVKAALSENVSLKISSMDEEIAKAAFKESDAMFLPRISVGYTAFSSNNPLNAFGFKLQQKGITVFDFDPDKLNHPSATPNFNTSISLQQPIYNADFIYMRKAAATQAEMYRHKTDRTKEALKWQVTQGYYQLYLAYRSMKVLEQSLTLALASKKMIDDRIAQGLLQPSDALNASVQIKSVEATLENLKTSIRNLSDNLSLMMKKPVGTIYSVEENTNTPVSNLPSSTVPIALNTARSDFKAMEAGLAGLGWMIQSSKGKYLPRLNGFGEYVLNDAKALSFGSNNFLLGIKLSWDVFNGMSVKNKINTQTLQKQQLEMQLVDKKSAAGVELQAANRAVEDAVFDISRQQTVVEQAEAAFTMIKNRHTQGLVGTTDLLLAQNQLSQQKMMLEQAIYQQKIAMAYLEFLKGYSN